jgi:tetratricopeptide (TPR) repeat protein
MSLSSMDTSTQDVGDRVAQVERMLADGEAVKARRAADELLAAHPQDARALYIAGRIARLAGQADAAVRWLQRSVDIDATQVRSYLELAAIFRSQRDFDRCLDALGTALFYEPENAQAYFELGNVHRLQGDLAGAEEFFGKAVYLDPALARAYTELGWIHLMREQYPQAIEMLEKAIELDPKSLVGHNNLGFAYVKTEQYERAMSLFSDLSTRMPSHMLWPKINLGNAYEHTGRFEQAAQV